jgi:hypothetical protein
MTPQIKAHQFVFSMVKISRWRIRFTFAFFRVPLRQSESRCVQTSHCCYNAQNTLLDTSKLHLPSYCGRKDTTYQQVEAQMSTSALFYIKVCKLRTL